MQAQLSMHSSVVFPFRLVCCSVNYEMPIGEYEGVSGSDLAFLFFFLALLLSPLATTLVGWKPMGTNKTIFVGAILET